MCTAVSVKVGDGYFGRNLDFEYDFGEKIVVVPRNFRFEFCEDKHYAIIGMALVEKGFPLFFDAMNECGLAMAGLRFAGNAAYCKERDGAKNIPSYELIPMILSTCKNIKEAENLLMDANITDEPFSGELPPSPLHWIVADRSRTITVEQTEKGLKVSENPIGVLTNNPEFSVQMENLKRYVGISPDEAECRFSKRIKIKSDSRGSGGIGLPGDWTSTSRFVKASFICENSLYSEKDEEIINHIFHTLYAVYQQRGCIRLGEGYEITNYTSCCNLSKGIYYYTTYNCSCISGVDMNKADLSGTDLQEYELVMGVPFNMQN